MEASGSSIRRPPFRLPAQSRPLRTREWLNERGEQTISFQTENTGYNISAHSHVPCELPKVERRKEKSIVE